MTMNKPEPPPKKQPSNPRLEEDLVLKERGFGSWEEWFNSTIASHEATGLDYSLFKPPSYMVPLYGDMPLPPWLRAAGQ